MRFFAWISFGALVQVATSVFIPNGATVVDSNGNPLDVHEGSISQWTPGGDYYWYGMGYGHCMIDSTQVNCAADMMTVGSMPCGYQLNHTINVFTSSDLLTWTPKGEILPQTQMMDGKNVSRPMGIYSRPKVIYNNDTKMYLLWVNRLPVTSMDTTIGDLLPMASYVVAQSSSPTGPFMVVTTHAATQYNGTAGFDILVNGSDAYIAYSAYDNNYKITIEKLTSNFTNITHPAPAEAADFNLETPEMTDTPAFFYYNSYYYLLVGMRCCFCVTGTGVRVFIGDGPMGQWGDVDLDIAYADGEDMISRMRAQLAGVFHIASPNGTVLIWAGDQWGLSLDGTLGHAYQYWVPITWNPDDERFPERLQVVTGFDTDAPYNLTAYLTGFCDTSDESELEDLLQALEACKDPSPTSTCYEQNLQRVTPDCGQCIIATGNLSMVMHQCVLPVYGMQTSDCNEMEAIHVAQLLAVCPVNSFMTSCPQQSSQVFSMVSATCHQCAMMGDYEDAFHLAAVCFPEGFMIHNYIGGVCLASEVSMLDDVVAKLQGCVDNACYEQTLQMVSSSCANCINNVPDLSMVMTDCVPSDYPTTEESPGPSIPSGSDVEITVVTAYLSNKYKQKTFDVSGITSLGAADLVVLVAAIVETETVLAVGAVFMYILTAATSAITIAQESSQTEESITTSVVSWGDASVSHAVCTSYTPTDSGFSQMGIQRAVNRVYYFLFAIDRLSKDGHLKNNLTFTFRIKIPKLKQGLALVVRTYNASFTSGVDITREGGIVRYIGASWWEITTHHTSALSGETTNSSSSSAEESSGSSDGLLGLLALLAFIPLCAGAAFYVIWSQRRQPPPIRYFDPAAAQPYPTAVSYSPPFGMPAMMPFNSTPSYEMPMSYSMPPLGTYSSSFPPMPSTDVYSSLATAPLGDAYPSMVTAPLVDVHPSFARPPPADGYPAPATAPATDGSSASNAMKLMTDANPVPDDNTTTIPSF